MLSDYERHTLDQIEASLARDLTRRRARRRAIGRAVRLVVAMLCLVATVTLTALGLLGPVAGALLSAASGVVLGMLLTDATRQWRIEVRLRQHLNRRTARSRPKEQN